MSLYLPTRDLTLEAIPEPDADSRDLIQFSGTFNGYMAVGMDEVQALAARLRDEGFQGFTLNELRVALFARQRAHYHQGGAWPGEPDTIMDQMRELVAEIRQRVASGEHQLDRYATPTISVWRGDITTLKIRAIVNAANETLLGGGGVDGAIHRAAGPELVEACRAVPELSPDVRCPVGQARITPGFELSARYVIHAVGPRWRDGSQGEDDALATAYRSILGLAEAHEIGAIAIPAISTGVYGFPPARAARIAVEAIHAWTDRAWPIRVTLVGFDEKASEVLRAAVDAGKSKRRP
ncbi:MAG: hypothetical protein Rubg2KO_20240 [Rubricoccaceae bacterium]